MFTQKLIVDRFIIHDLQESLLGRGGMGNVYKGVDIHTRETIAIKVLKRGVTVRDPDIVTRFIREGEALRHLNHPNIVKMLDMVEEDGQYYLIMEYVRGGSLRDLLLRHKQLSEEQVLQIGLELVDALTRAHYLDIIHRDLKPDNVLLDENGATRLTDFGIARFANKQRLTKMGEVVGTIYYLSPEACRGEELDTRADIWAFGVLLYEMLVGTVPFSGETMLETMTAIQTQPTPDLTLYRPDMPDALSSLIQHMLMKSRSERIPSIRMVGMELEAIMQGKNIKDSSGYVRITPAATRPLTEDNLPGSSQAKLFVCYAQHIEPDKKLAVYLYEELTGKGYQVFIDQTLRIGTAWLNEIDNHIKDSDYMVVLLSKKSADSEMVQSEVKRAYDYRKQQGHPQILPVRIAYTDLLPYSIDAFLDPLQYVVWEDESDNKHVIEDILMAIKGILPDRRPFPAAYAREGIVVSEDGRNIASDVVTSAPLPEFDPRLLEELMAPGGTVKLRDRFYVERKADDELRRQVSRPGSITTIRASRQTGKSSLLVRGAHYARQLNYKTVNLDLQHLDRDDLENPDTFLRYLATFIARKLRLDATTVNKVWQGSLGPQAKLTYFMEDHVLSQTNERIILAMDEADRLLETDFHTDFFGLIRSWHNNAAYEQLWERLSLVMVISTEPYLLIADVNQSPFNVGTKLYLEDFSETQMRDLNRRHGSPISDSNFPQFSRLLRGHPYLTRKALYTLITDNISWKEFVGIAATDNGPFNDHLRRQLWLLRDEPELRITLKQAVLGKRCQNEEAHFRLLRAGLVKGSGTVCKCRCDLYRIYFEDKL